MSASMLCRLAMRAMVAAAGDGRHALKAFTAPLMGLSGSMSRSFLARRSRAGWRSMLCPSMPSLKRMARCRYSLILHRSSRGVRLEDLGCVLRWVIHPSSCDMAASDVKRASELWVEGPAVFSGGGMFFVADIAALLRSREAFHWEPLPIMAAHAHNGRFYQMDLDHMARKYAAASCRFLRNCRQKPPSCIASSSTCFVKVPCATFVRCGTRPLLSHCPSGRNGRKTAKEDSENPAEKG
ncbi:fucose kinase [Trypanosoma rangeli]|uniref:Fucose kinase n=1 Tax=Trypanosoma rangeli TaxID=5698 RepID=A0A3R7K5E8_TRYRA|nr:fucose kinase [Trypanosoma rangeli]RNF01992.1 fucose kinase [Trypanosoma rangeli]|eukprot:RNF01992.1 fucose kinase [Trypanosoma rangeli]